jgi:hypothetical protein
MARIAERHFVPRPFAGLPSECEWVAMREIIPAATTSIRLIGDYADRDVTVCTLLAGALPAQVMSNGHIFIALQTASATGDPAADLGRALTAALAAQPGSLIQLGPRRPDAPRLQDMIDTASDIDVTVHDGFDYWIDPESEPNVDLRSTLEEANSAIVPTIRLNSVASAYWCSLGDRDQVRWVLPDDEEPLLDGLARLHVANADTLGDGTRLLGTFRAHGLLVPVWDLVKGTPADQVDKPAKALAERLAQAIAEQTPLDRDQRRARAGLANRQVTIR